MDGGAGPGSGITIGGARGDGTVRPLGPRAQRASSRAVAPGQAIVEFALVAPILILILGAVLQFGLIFQRQIGIENAVRETARLGATWAATTDATAGTNAGAAWTALMGSGKLLQTNVQGYDGNWCPVSSVCARVCYYQSGTAPNPSAAPAPTDPASGKQVLVTAYVTYYHPLIIPVIAQILDGIDGTLDSPPALQIATSSTFTVQNGTDTPNLSASDCFPVLP